MKNEKELAIKIYEKFKNKLSLLNLFEIENTIKEFDDWSKAKEFLK